MAWGARCCCPSRRVSLLTFRCGTDYVDTTGQAYVVLADVLAAAETLDEAAQAFAEAAMLFGRKGNVISAARAHNQIAALQTEA
jgi:uncharacterized Ntn-hydrolase superfamily protein